jgi:hypothetical protein
MMVVKSTDYSFLYKPSEEIEAEFYQIPVHVLNPDDLSDEDLHKFSQGLSPHNARKNR